ncbi:uncharacterized protein LOC133491300 isoform X2 [Syngnathoides biaculeatus]|uniref:uncharacterized protein LOC133491300 isoform X2 n=1 Tax=Syngnathoides biaculeatus TaxID=300417 RepID=UPI002ADE053B|nr:uncharacterized protein LOC133491300 isoform X2 [Syngnathoides biaculeatus]
MESPIEPKYMRCSNFNMPLLETEFFKSELQLYIDGLTTEMWDLIEYGHFDFNAFIMLFKMWQTILYKISQEVLSVVLPQVEEHAQIPMDDYDSLQWALNLSSVTEDDIHACIWDSLLLALKNTINAGDAKCPCGDHLLELVAAKVSKTVNNALSEISSQLDSVPHLDVPHQVSEIGEIALQSISVLRACLENMRLASGFECEEVCAYSDSSEDTTDVLVAPLPTPVQTYNEQEESHLHAHSPAVAPTKTGNICLHPPAETWTKKENIFCTVFLWKLMDHIAHSNAKSVLEMDIDWMLAQLKSTVVETRPNHPQNIGDFHIEVYKDLCQEFGSKERLYLSMACCQLAFVEALARALKKHLQGPKKRNFFTKVRAFFKKRTAKVSMACGHGRMRLRDSTNTKKL